MMLHCICCLSQSQPQLLKVVMRMHVPRNAATLCQKLCCCNGHRHGVRASAVSTHYSQDDEQLSNASDQETADGSLYVGSFAPVGPFHQTVSSFALNGDANASGSLRSHPQQQYSDVSRSLEVEESLLEEHSHDYDEGLLLPQQPQQPPQQQQQVQQPQQRRQWSQPPTAAMQRSRSRRSVDSLLDEDKLANCSAAVSVSSSLAGPGPLRQAPGVQRRANGCGRMCRAACTVA